MNDIIFIKGAGGLGRVAGAQDYLSGLVFYDEEFETTSQMVALGISTFTDTSRIHDYSSLSAFETATGMTETNLPTKLYWYQVREYFRLNPTGKVYIGLFTDTSQIGVPVAVDFEEINTLQTYADGTLRQVGVLLQSNTFATSDVELIQGICDTLEDEHMPLSVIYGADSDTISTGSFADLRDLSTVSPNVSVMIGQDGDNDGAALFTSGGFSIPAIGAGLGAISSAKVNESIAWVSKFNFSGGGELENPAIGDGTLVKDLTTASKDALNTKGYIFLLKHVGIAGTYVNENSTCDVVTSDYAYMAEVRTIDKAIRGIRTALLPELNSPIQINPSDGTISIYTIKSLENLAQKPLTQMEIDKELSGSSVTIDPAQDVLSTSKVEVTVRLVPYATAREIEVTIGFTTQL